MNNLFDSKLQIVVIDDSRSILEYFSNLLITLGYENIHTFSSPIEALNTIKASPQKYDLIFTDLNMPELDGMGLIRELGKIHFNGGVCIISELDKRIIDLASDVTKQLKILLVGSISKPIDKMALKIILLRFEQLRQQKNLNSEPLSKDELINCVANKLIEPYFQPKVNLITKQVDSLEVLARIQKPGQTDAILPARFIQAAIDYDLMDLVTLQLAEKSTHYLPQLKKVFGDELKICINLSPHQLNDLELTKKINYLFREYQFERNKLIFEITEEFALKSSEQLETLNRLRINGYGVSLDDFGTGFTNIQQLRQLPFSEVKIDRSFIQNIHQDSFSQLIVNTLAEYADSLGITLVAEGVEKVEDLLYLSDKHPNVLLQGFLISRPKEINSLLNWHKSWLMQTNANMIVTE